MSLARGAVGVLTVALFCSACGTPAPPVVATSTAPLKPALPTSTSTAPSMPPTPTATLTPAPHTFTEGFDAGAPYWIFLQAGVPGGALNRASEGGALRFDLTDAEQWVYALYDPYVYEDVRVDAVVEFGAAGQASAGVICRYDPAVGWYEFNIHPDGTYSLLFGQWLADGIARYAPLVVAESEHILPSANEIGLVCEADILTPYINGTQLRKRQEKLHVLTEGKVGLAAASFENGGLAISYDWVSVGSP